VGESHKTSILFVEDHASTARVVGKYLGAIGYDVQVASDVASARKLARGHAFDILLCDIQLPDGTGWDLMRELNRKRSLPGIAISGFASDADLERSERAGFAKHLAKPFSPEDLTAAIEALPVASD
jgi:CheY-like chemotaxis protein